MSKVQYFTPEGLEKLKAELEHLTTKGRAEMSHQIAEAREKGEKMAEETGQSAEVREALAEADALAEAEHDPQVVE